MSSVVGQISFAHARQLAVDAVMRDRSHYERVDIESPLEGDFLEAEHCWIFFRSKRIIVVPGNWFTKSYGAFAVSKKGAISQITTFENDRLQQLGYLKTMSDYFQQRGE